MVLNALRLTVFFINTKGFILSKIEGFNQILNLKVFIVKWFCIMAFLGINLS